MLKKLCAVLSALCVLVLVMTFLGCGSSTSRPSATLLVGSQGDNTLLAYRSDLTTGRLTQVSTSVSTTDTPNAIFFDPSGSSAYVATQDAGGAGRVAAFTVDNDGKLGGGGTSQDVGSQPIAMGSDGAGHLYVVNRGSNSISSFTMSSGTLSRIAGDVPTGLAPNSITFSPDGRFAYVTNQADDNVGVYSVATGGELTEITNSGNRYATQDAPASSALATTATGSYLYVANSGSNNVTAYIVCLTTIAPCMASDGSLMPVAGSPFGAGLNPVSILVDPTNTFAYVLAQDSNQITGYRINAATGAIATISPANVSTGARPVTMAFHSDGGFLYVVNSRADTLGGFSVQAQSGVLSPVTPVATSATPAGLAVR